MIIKNKEIKYLLIGFALRVFFAPWTEQRWDMYLNRLFCAYVYGYGLDPFWPWSGKPLVNPPILHYSYPPVWLFTLLSLFPIWLITTGYRFPRDVSDLWQYGTKVDNIFESYRSFIPSSLPLLDLILKLPNILADIVIGYTLLKLAFTPTERRIVILFWIFNPFIIQVSTIWGAFDAFATLFAFVSLYLLWKHRNFFSAVALSLGVGTKLYPVFFLIPILIYVYKRSGGKAALEYLSVVIVVCATIFLTHFLFPSGLFALQQQLIKRASPDWMGKNVFSGLTWLSLLSVIELRNNLPVFLLVFIPAYVLLNWLFWKSTGHYDSLIIYLTRVLLIIYISYPIINPQYIYWILPPTIYLLMRGEFSKRIYLALNIIPLVWMHVAYNPLYFLSPIIVWDEWHYPPWSNIIIHLRTLIPISSVLLFLSCTFSLICMLGLIRHVQDYFNFSIKIKFEGKLLKFSRKIQR